MKRLRLDTVTLCIADTRTPAVAVESLRHSMRQVDFARVVLFAHGSVPQPGGIDCIDIGPLASAAAYSEFIVRRLPALVDTPHVLVSQWDGFVTSADAWRDDFLQYDYIGAPWHDQPAALSVGNGGFSLRSQRFLQAGLDARLPVGAAELHPEDECLCRTHRALLESTCGVRFAPPRLASRFAFENLPPRVPTFGFHGVFNLPRFLPEPELARWLHAMPQAFYRGRDGRRLARALVRRGMPRTARWVVAQRAAQGRREPSTRLIGAAAALMQWLRP